MSHILQDAHNIVIDSPQSEVETMIPTSVDSRAGGDTIFHNSFIFIS